MTESNIYSFSHTATAHTVSSVENELQRIKAGLPKRLDLMALTGERQGLREALNQLYSSVHELIDVVFVLEGVLQDQAPHPNRALRVGNG